MSANPLGLPLYIISLVEHKSRVEYNVIMQVLRYMVYIWEDYEKDMERLFPGISSRKDFRYPPPYCPLCTMKAQKSGLPPPIWRTKFSAENCWANICPISDIN